MQRLPSEALPVVVGDPNEVTDAKAVLYKREDEVVLVLKGRKNKRRGTKESDWRTYWGSNSHLVDDVLRLGEHRFTREILHYCPSRGVASYLEAQEQFERKVLETDDYYNGIINVRIGGSKILRESLKKYSKI